MTAIEFAPGWLSRALRAVRRDVERMRPEDRPQLVRPAATQRDSDGSDTATSAPSDAGQQ